MMRALRPILVCTAIVALLVSCIAPSFDAEDSAMVTVKIYSGIPMYIGDDFADRFTAVSVTLTGVTGTAVSARANIIPDLQAAVAVFSEVPPGDYDGFILNMIVDGTETNIDQFPVFSVAAGSQVTIDVTMNWNIPAITISEVVSATGGPTTGIGFISTNDQEKGEIYHTVRAVGVGEAAATRFVQVRYPDDITYFIGSKSPGPVFLSFISTANGFILDRTFPDHVAEEGNINGTYSLTVDYGSGFTYSGSTDISVNFTGPNSFGRFTAAAPHVINGDTAVNPDSSQSFEVNLDDIPASGIRTMLFYIYDRYNESSQRVVHSEVMSSPAPPHVLNVFHNPDPALDTLEWNQNYGAVVLFFDADVPPEFFNLIEGSHGKKDMETAINLILSLDGVRSDFDIGFIAGASIFFRTL